MLEARSMEVETGLQHMVIDDGVATGEVGDVYIVLWREPVIQRRFLVQKDGLLSAIRRHGRCSMLCVVEAGTQPPDDDLRRASIDMVRTHAPKLISVGCVIEGAGFQAAITRSVLSGMALILRNSEPPVHFFRTVAQSEGFLARDRGLDGVSLPGAVEHLRQALPPRTSH